MSKATKKDGRTLRAERSRAAVANATLDLIREGHLKPTAAAVAERAGVSLRLVFHHFKDMDAVLRFALDLQASEIAPLLPVVFPADADAAERVKIFVERRARLYETIAPTRRASIQAEPTSPAIAEILQKFRKSKADQLAFLFQDTLSGLDANERKERMSAAQSLASYSSWSMLRDQQGLSPKDAKAAIRRGLELLLDL